MRVAPEAWPFVLPFPLLALFFLLKGRPRKAIGALVAGIGILLFFRDPRRQFEGEEEIVLAPADGRVTAIDTVEVPALGDTPCRRIVTFLSVFDVHVQRVPASGVVVTSRHRPGRKIAAFFEHADRVNESHLTILERADGDRVGIRQIAGLLARRIVCRLVPGQTVRRGESLGLIKFGSRVDLLVPGEYEVLVSRGDRVRNGETPVARPGDSGP
ncbi:MAG: phosphatidylserine decarboxylase [Thermoanaerobaculia bacterium]|nr:phosphatidylserine decarboxylase [Thermoanaerobaculia bacterium]